MGKDLNIRSSATEFLIFEKQAHADSIEVRYEDGTLWLTQKMMANLFDVSVPTINEHLKNVFSEGELDEPSVIRNSRITASDAKSYHTNHYNSDAVISMEYRIIDQKNVLKYIFQSIRTNIRLIRRKFTPFAR